MANILRSYMAPIHKPDLQGVLMVAILGTNLKYRNSSKQENHRFKLFVRQQSHT